MGAPSLAGFSIEYEIDYEDRPPNYRFYNTRLAGFSLQAEEANFFLTVLDQDFNALEGVGVSCVATDGTWSRSGSTAGNGTYNTYLVLGKTYTITLSKQGYRTRSVQLTMDGKREEMEVLEALDETPPTFVGLQSAADLGTGGEVQLTWQAASDNDTGVGGYNIYYHTVNDAAQILAQGVKQKAPADAMGAVVGGLINGTIYYFIVRAFDNEKPPNEDANEVIKSATPTASLLAGGGFIYEIEDELEYQLEGQFSYALQLD